MSDQHEGTEPEGPPESEQSPEQPASAGAFPPARGLPLTLATIAVVAAVVYLIARILVARGEEIPPASPPPPPPGPIAADFRPLSVLFFDEDHGLISGTVPCANCDTGRQGVIASTADAGKTWQTRYRGDRPILGLTHIGATSAVWATATYCNDPSFVKCHLSYLLSDDLGATWQRATPTNGYRVSPPPSPGRPCRRDHPYPVSSSFPTPRHGWVFCGYTAVSSSYQFKGLYETFNAGRLWIELPEFHPGRNGRTVNPANMPEDGFASGISFLQDGSGFLWTSGKYSSLSYTTRAGKRWVRVWHSDEGSGQQVVAASLFADATGYVLMLNGGSGYSLQLTRDAGRTRQAVQFWPLPTARTNPAAPSG